MLSSVRAVLGTTALLARGWLATSLFLFPINFLFTWVQSGDRGSVSSTQRKDGYEKEPISITINFDHLSFQLQSDTLYFRKVAETGWTRF